MVDLLAVVAHPDDAAIFCGGTIAKHAARGDEVAIAYMTRGGLGGVEEATPEAVAETRAEEAAVAADTLGAASVEFPGYDDGGVEATLANRRALAGTLREHAPAVVITHARDDPHPDHVATATLVDDAYYLASLPLAPVDGDAHDVANVYHVGKAATAFEPTTFVDVTDQIDAKLRAIEAHESQAAFMADHGGIDAGWDDLVADARAQARTYGRRVGVRYAEGFRPLQDRPTSYLA